MAQDRPSSEPETLLRNSPVDFNTAVAYALQPDMRRLIILYIVGLLITPVGLGLFFDPAPFASLPVELVQRVAGLLISIAGATLLFGGVVGVAFKLITDANMLAAEQ